MNVNHSPFKEEEAAKLTKSSTRISKHISTFNLELRPVLIFLMSRHRVISHDGKRDLIKQMYGTAVI